MSRFESLEPVLQQTTASMVADQIRRAIINGSFEAGMQLTEAQLVERLGVSRGPIREALQRLIQEGLLRSHRNRGVFVVELGTADVADIYLARRAIEGIAIGVLVQRDDRSAVDLLAAHVSNLRRACESGDWATVADLDLRFHELLVGATASTRLVRMFHTLLAETRMCLGRLEAGYPVWTELAAEHEAIVEAIRAGNEAEALELLDAHFASAVRELDRSPTATGSDEVT